MPPISDEYERLFSSCKILLKDWRSRLKIDIIKANKCLRHRYGPPLKGTFDNKDIGKAEGKEYKVELSPKEQAKARLAAAVAAEAAAEAAAETAAQEEDAAADEDALAEEEEEAIEHGGEVEDEEREGSEVEGELPDINWGVI